MQSIVVYIFNTFSVQMTSSPSLILQYVHHTSVLSFFYFPYLFQQSYVKVLLLFLFFFFGFFLLSFPQYFASLRFWLLRDKVKQINKQTRVQQHKTSAFSILFPVLLAFY